MNVIRCDHCREEMDPDLPITVLYAEEQDPPSDDLEAAVEFDCVEAHFCSWPCLASWSMEEALEQQAVE